MSRSADSLAREHTERAIEVLSEALEDDDAKYRIAAANSLLDRGHGKPLTATIQVPTTRAQALRLASMSDEEIMAAIKSTPLPQLAARSMSPEEYAAIEHQTAGLDADLDPLLA